MSFDCEGLGRARMALVEMARKPKANPKNSVTYDLVHELYVEIRDARLAGYGWKAIKEALGVTKIGMSASTLARVFSEIDKKYESETGVPALNVNAAPAKKRGRPAKK